MELAQNKALGKAQFLHQVLEKENMMERTWAQKIHAKAAREAVTLKDKLRTTEKDIQSLKNTVNKCEQEARELQSKLSVNEVQLGSADLRLQQVERRAYKNRFEGCKALAK